MSYKIASIIGEALAKVVVISIVAMFLVCFAKFELFWNFSDQDWKVYRFMVAIAFAWEWFRPSR